MLIGLVGAPNKGKSTLFSAMTMNEVAIADYPFTTINPNMGVAYATRKCVHAEFGVKCNARNSLCVNGIRMFPINVTDVAGLVEGAHEGKGMGNQFLNDLANAEALIIVVDASGKTDSAGNKAASADPMEDIKMVHEELTQWLAGIVKKHMNTVSRRSDGSDALYEILAGFRATKEDIEAAASAAHLSTVKPNWSDDSILAFSAALINVIKPTIIAANKSDVQESAKNIAALQAALGRDNVVPCSGAIELALRKAAKTGVIEYTPGAQSFTWKDRDVSEERLHAIKYMEDFLKSKGTNVQELINAAAFRLLDNIVVYPVEDEHKFTDHFGNVLPDGILIKRGSTAHQLADKIHTSIAKGMLYAVDARTKRRLGRDYVLHDNDVIKIVSAAK
jgi:ribosome-binding ATPase